MSQRMVTPVRLSWPPRMATLMPLLSGPLGLMVATSKSVGGGGDLNGGDAGRVGRGCLG